MHKFISRGEISIPQISVITKCIAEHIHLNQIFLHSKRMEHSVTDESVISPNCWQCSVPESLDHCLMKCKRHTVHEKSMQFKLPKFRRMSHLFSMSQLYLEPFVAIVFVEIRDFLWKISKNYPNYFMSEPATKKIKFNKKWAKHDSNS